MKIVTSIVAVLIVLGALLYIGAKTQIDEKIGESKDSGTWRTFSNEHFEFQYPSEWSIGPGGLTQFGFSFTAMIPGNDETGTYTQGIKKWYGELFATIKSRKAGGQDFKDLRSFEEESLKLSYNKRETGGESFETSGHTVIISDGILTMPTGENSYSSDMYIDFDKWFIYGHLTSKEEKDIEMFHRVYKSFVLKNSNEPHALPADTVTPQLLPLCDDAPDPDTCRKEMLEGR